MKSQPFLFPVCGLIAGILFSESFRNEGFADVRWVLIIAFLIVLFILLRKKGWSSALVLTVFSVYGFLSSELYNRWKPLPEQLLDREISVDIRIKETFRSSGQYRKYSARILSAEQHKTGETGVLVYWDRNQPELYTGDEIRVRTGILNLHKPLNPYQFDYSAYLNRKGIHYSFFHKDSFVKLNEPKGFGHTVAVFKRKIHKNMLESGYSKPAADLVGAMLLGDRTEMDTGIEEDYRKTGVVHLLSISGLHVVMVYSIFMLLLYPLVYLKNGKNIRIVLSLVLIWFFVAFVEFGPPVFRSGLMISVYYITVLLRRKPNVYHTLLLSAMILLLFNPNFIFDAGFLLSFSAVFFIVYFNPVYQKIFKPKTRTGRNVVGFIGTSISAQMGTLPFSVFFFNQTSGLFLAGNVVMIAASYPMVAGGMITVLLTAFGIEFDFWRKIFDLYIQLCNAYVHRLARFDALVFERLSLSGIEMVLLLLVFLMLRQVYFSPKAKHLYVFLSLIFVFEANRLYKLNQLLHKEEIIVFHQSRNTVIGVRKAFYMDLYLAEPGDSVQIEKYTVRPYMIHQKIRKFRLLNLDSKAKGFYTKTADYFELNNRRLVLYPAGSDSLIRPGDYVLVRDNAGIDSIPADVYLVTDGSNYPNHSKKLNYPNVWDTREKGALIIE